MGNIRIHYGTSLLLGLGGGHQGTRRILENSEPVAQRAGGLNDVILPLKETVGRFKV